MIFKLELDTDEIAFLLNEKPNSNRVKSLLEEVKRHQSQQEVEEESVEIFPEPKDAKKGGKGKGGKKEDAKGAKKKGKSDKKSASKDTKEPGPVTAKTTEEPKEEDEEDSKSDKKKEVQKSLFDF
jgi:hypothetical protein